MKHLIDFLNTQRPSIHVCCKMNKIDYDGYHRQQDTTASHCWSRRPKPVLWLSNPNGPNKSARHRNFWCPYSNYYNYNHHSMTTYLVFVLVLLLTVLVQPSKSSDFTNSQFISSYNRNSGQCKLSVEHSTCPIISLNSSV